MDKFDHSYVYVSAAEQLLKLEDKGFNLFDLNKNNVINTVEGKNFVSMLLQQIVDPIYKEYVKAYYNSKAPLERGVKLAAIANAKNCDTELKALILVKIACTMNQANEKDKTKMQEIVAKALNMEQSTVRSEKLYEMAGELLGIKFDDFSAVSKAFQKAPYLTANIAVAFFGEGLKNSNKQNTGKQSDINAVKELWSQLGKEVPACFKKLDALLEKSSALPTNMVLTM